MGFPKVTIVNKAKKYYEDHTSGDDVKSLGIPARPFGYIDTSLPKKEREERECSVFFLNNTVYQKFIKGGFDRDTIQEAVELCNKRNPLDNIAIIFLNDKVYDMLISTPTDKTQFTTMLKGGKADQYYYLNNLIEDSTLLSGDVHTTFLNLVKDIPKINASVLSSGVKDGLIDSKLALSYLFEQLVSDVSKGSKVYLYKAIRTGLKPAKLTGAIDTKLEARKLLETHMLKGFGKYEDIEYVTWDIETTGLKLYSERILSVSFTVKYKDDEDFIVPNMNLKKTCEIKRRLIENSVVYYFGKPQADVAKDFILDVLEKLTHWGVPIVGHNILQFDIPMLSKSMEDNLRITNILAKGNIIDTMVMAYPFLNSINKRPLGLKSLGYIWMGNYDENLDQSRLEEYDPNRVMDYNILDTVANAVIYDNLKQMLSIKNNNIIKMYKDNPSKVADALTDKTAPQSYLKRSMKVGKMLALMKLAGVPLGNKEDIKKKVMELNRDTVQLYSSIQSNSLIQETEKILTKRAYERYNHKLVNKITFAYYTQKKGNTSFNFASTAHKVTLFFDVMKLPKSIVPKTKSGAPTTGKESIDLIINYALDNKSASLNSDAVRLMLNIKEVNEKTKLRDAYLQPMLDLSIRVPKGTPSGGGKSLSMVNEGNGFTLHTNFKQASTITGRLSTSDGMNFLALPAHGFMGKTIKNFIQAEKGWVFVASDYSALESRLLANESGDPEQAKPFLLDIDGHSLNALAYYPTKLKSINDKVAEALEAGDDDAYREAVNSVKDLYPELRQESKPYTFGLSYGAGPGKFGKVLYERYWNLYIKTRQYYDGIIDEVKQNRTMPYIISSISGLPLMSNPFTYGMDKYKVEAIERKFSNFTIQSGNFLLLESMADLMFDYLIPKGYLFTHVKMINSIHDACYMVIKEDSVLIKEVTDKWIELASRDYRTDQIVPLEIECDIGYKWSDVTTIPINASAEHISNVLSDISSKESDATAINASAEHTSNVLS